ncbi:MAG: DUF1501 domain-containing protein [Bacteroidota bacterium]
MKRRSFLTKTALGLASPLVSNAFGGSTKLSSILSSAISTVDLANDHVLVLIQLAGGNDGLNTILPLETFGNLWAARNSIIVPDDRFLVSKLSKRIAFHPAIEGLKNMFDDSKLRIVNSVGYPNPDFSHFKSTDIWMSGSNSNETLLTGWLGRYLSDEYSNYPNNYPNVNFPDPPAIVTTSVLPFLLQGESSNFGEVVINPSNNYQLYDNKLPFISSGKAAKELEFLRQSGSLSNQYSSKLFENSSKVSQQKPYPDTGLGSQLKNIANLIAGGVKTKIYIASMSGFDTHANQVDRAEPWKGTHANLLRELSEAIVAFQTDLKFLGVSKRVIGATFSEFGRRVGSNASLGSDHGAAAPMIIFGEQALGGVAGDNPMIEQYANPNTNVPMQFDFRSVFSSLLKDWFCVNQNTLEKVFMKNFQYIPLVANLDCLGITGNEEVDENDNLVNIYRPDINSGTQKILSSETTLTDGNRLMAYPNSFHKTLKLEFESEGGHCILQIFNSLGQQIAVVNEGNFQRGYYKAVFDGQDLPDSLYYVRFQNKSFQKVLNVVKASR